MDLSGRNFSKPIFLWVFRGEGDGTIAYDILINKRGRCGLDETGIGWVENWLHDQKTCQKFTARKGGNGKYGAEPVAFVSVYGLKEG